jgi:hypothetical protein
MRYFDGSQILPKTRLILEEILGRYVGAREIGTFHSPGAVEHIVIDPDRDPRRAWRSGPRRVHCRRRRCGRLSGALIDPFARHAPGEGLRGSQPQRGQAAVEASPIPQSRDAASAPADLGVCEALDSAISVCDRPPMRDWVSPAKRIPQPLDTPRAFAVLKTPFPRSRVCCATAVNVSLPIGGRRGRGLPDARDVPDLSGRVVVSVWMAPKRDVLTLMEDAEDEDIRLANAVQEPKRIHKELANVRISVLRDWRASLTEDPE